MSAIDRLARTNAFSRDDALPEYGLACATPMLEGALRLVHDQYVARGYMAPDPTGWRLGLHHAVPSTRVFVARNEGKVVGTVTLIEDSPIGLPMDDLYGKELSDLRGERRRLAEVSALAVSSEYGPAGIVVVKSLIRMLVLHAMEVARCDDISIVVNPRHVKFYRTLFPDAEQIGELKAYHKVNGAPAVPLRLDLHILRALIPKAQAETGDVGEAYAFLFRADRFAETVTRLRQQSRHGVLTSKQFVRFFAAHPALARATAAERAFIQSLYPGVDVAALVDSYRARDTENLADAPFEFALVPA